MSDKWQTYLRENGITHETGAPYSHASNSVAERAIRTIIDATRSMLVDSGLSWNMWAEASKTFCDVRNLLPSARHPGMIPEERWTGKRQDVAHLHSFGCVAYARIAPEIDQSKLAPRSIKYTMLGYFGRDAYKLYDRASHTIIKCRNVIFEEGKIHHTTDSISLSHDPSDVPDEFLTPVRPDSDTAVAPMTDDRGRPNVLHPHAPVAARPRSSDPPPHIPTDNPAPDTSEPQPRRSSRLATNSTKSKAARESEESALREIDARRNGEDWAANTSRPRVFMAEKEDVPEPFNLHDHLLSIFPNFKYLALLSTTPNTSNIPIPSTYNEAMTQPDVWVPAMQAELDVLAQRQVFQKVLVRKYYQGKGLSRCERILPDPGP